MWLNLYGCQAVRSKLKKRAKNTNAFLANWQYNYAWTYLQLPLRQLGACNVYLLVLSSLKVNIAENPIAVMGL